MESTYEKMQIEPQQIGESNSQYAYRVLYSNILYLNLLPGQVITDLALVDVLNISRTPIREALFRLREEQLIDIYSKKKTIVSYIDYKVLNESILVRSSVESSIIKELCGKLDVSWRPRFEENLKIQKLFAHEHSLGNRYYEFDNEFHHLLFEASGREWTWRKMEQLCAQINRVRYINYARLSPDDIDGGVIARFYEDHEKLYNCIIENTPELVDDLVASHTGNKRIMDKWLSPDSELREYIINLE